MLHLRLAREEPVEARENLALCQTLARLTAGTHDRKLGFALLPSEAQALYDALAHRTFSLTQLDAVEAAIRKMDPHELGSGWDDDRFACFVKAVRHCVARPEWIDNPIHRLHDAMRAQGPHKRFRRWFLRAALVAFLAIDFLSTNPEDHSRLAG